MPPQVGAWRLRMPNLLVRNENWWEPRALVKRSASCSLEEICAVAMDPDLIQSRIKWQSISICFVRSWCTELATIWMAARLSQYNWVEIRTIKSWNKVRSQIISQAVVAIERYSTSAEERETVVCFLIF